MSEIRIRQEAEAELASEWYEFQVAGLGRKFVLEVNAAIKRAAENPEIYEVVYETVRRVLMRRFPYAVYFINIKDGIEIFAILHQQRDPITWKSRLTA